MGDLSTDHRLGSRRLFQMQPGLSVAAMKRRFGSPAGIFRRMPYPIETFPFGDALRVLIPFLLKRNGDRMRQLPGLFGKVNEESED